jgi:hypothetical protein
MTVRFGGGAGHYQPPCEAACRYQMCEAVDMAVPEGVCMTDAVPEPEGSGEEPEVSAPEPEGSGEEPEVSAPEPEGSGEEIRRMFREALERKRARNADAGAGRGGKDAGKVHGARGLARSRRSFRRKTGG